MKKTTLSLQEQLLKSGLSNQTQAKQINAAKRKQAKVERNGGAENVDEIRLAAEQARQLQLERDRDLNRQRQAQEHAKQLQAQIRQITLLNRLPQTQEGVTFQFNHHNKVKSLYVNDNIRQALIGGRLGIIALDNGYEIVPAEIARRIQQRAAENVVLLNTVSTDNINADDPYAAYQIPDDLIW